VEKPGMHTPKPGEGGMITPTLTRAYVERIFDEIDNPVIGWAGGVHDTVHRITKEPVVSMKGKNLIRYRVFLTERHGFRVISTMDQWRAFGEEPCMYRISLARLHHAFAKTLKESEQQFT